MLYTLFGFTLLFLSVFSQDYVCVSDTPVDSTYWWNGLWESNGTYNSKTYYSRKAPGDVYYLYYDTYSGGSCPYSWMTNCWCFDTYGPGEYTFDCEVAGVGDTPDAVTSWYPDDFTADNSTFADFEVAVISDTSTCTSADSQLEDGCYEFSWNGDESEPEETGKYRDTEKVWWYVDQFKTTKTGKILGITYRYNYFLFISTGEGACNETVLSQQNNGNGYDYCWCFGGSSRAGTIGTFSCDYMGPVSTYTTKPSDVVNWYDYNGDLTTAVVVDDLGDAKTCDACKFYINIGLIAFLIFNIFVNN